MVLRTGATLGIVTIASTLFFPAVTRAAIPAGERNALIAIYNRTGGDGWFFNQGWRKSPGVFSDAGTECSWYGVGCNASGTTVEVLDLQFDNLSGSIPPELADLVNLRHLDLCCNNLSGAIPPELGRLANLRVLVLGASPLTGAIPPELGDLANLTELSLYDTALSGAIPRQLGRLGRLESLFLVGNQLTGSIPAELGELANLRELWLGVNRLTGAIPPELGRLASLELLDLNINQLTGAIPPELGRLASLALLNLQINELTGAIPGELGELANLRELRLSMNQLSGGIPPQLGDLGSLEVLFLSSNQLEGAIPFQLANLVNLRNIDLRFNHLYTDSSSLREFLVSKGAGPWESFQTLFRYFAQFGEDDGLSSQIVLFNLNDVSEARGEIELRWVSPTGQTGRTTRNLIVRAGGLINPPFAVGSMRQGSVRVTSDRHLEGVVIFGGDFGLAGVGSGPQLPNGFLAPMQVRQNLGVNTGIALGNWADRAASLDFSLLDAAGNAIAASSDRLASGGHKALFVTEIGWDPPVDFSDFSGTLVVTSSQPVTATVIQTRVGEFVTFPVAPLHVAGPGESAPAQRLLHFAQFADGEGLSSQLLLLNLSDLEPAHVAIAIRDDPGNPLTVDLDGQQVAGVMELDMAPRALRILATDGQGALLGGSVTVTSDQPLAGVLIFSGDALGAAGVGASQTLAEGFVASMETDSEAGINTGVALMNLESRATTLDAELRGSDGRVLAESRLRIPKRGHRALFVTDFQWDAPVDLGRFQGLLRVRANGRTAATVIQTRPGQFATMPVADKPTY